MNGSARGYAADQEPQTPVIAVVGRYPVHRVHGSSVPISARWSPPSFQLKGNEVTELNYDEYRQQVRKTKERLKRIIESDKNNNQTSHRIMFSALGEAMAEYGMSFIGGQHTLMMLDELSGLVLQAETERSKGR